MSALARIQLCVSDIFLSLDAGVRGVTGIEFRTVHIHVAP